MTATWTVRWEGLDGFIYAQFVVTGSLETLWAEVSAWYEQTMRDYRTTELLAKDRKLTIRMGWPDYGTA